MKIAHINDSNCLKLIWKLMVHIWQCSTSKYLDLIFNGKHFWKFEFLRKKIPKYNFDFTWLANHVPYGSALKLYSKMIFSCLRINSNRAEILKSTPLLSSIKYKNDSLCLYTLYLEGRKLISWFFRSWNLSFFQQNYIPNGWNTID